jgi:hypothetical protein
VLASFVCTVQKPPPWRRLPERSGPARLNSPLASQGHRALHNRCQERDRTGVPFQSCPEAQKLRFQGADHFAALCGSFRLGPEGSLDGLCSATTRASPLCWRGASSAVLACASGKADGAALQDTGTREESGPGNTGNGSPEISEKNENTDRVCGRPVAAVAALAPVCWLAPAPGASSPESALGVDPRLLQNEPEDLDTRDSGGENKPTLWAAPILVLF